MTHTLDKKPLERPLFLLTVDTEEEWDWQGQFPIPPFSTRNIDQIPEFQAVCKTLGVRPTYFVDYAVATNTDNSSLLKHYLDLGECDIGAHLHPWCTPPIVEEINEHNSHAVNLPLLLFQKKIVALTDALIKAFGCHPYSYRAGRWGVNCDHLRTLADSGYRIDSSVRPFYSDTSFSYQNAPTSAYWPSFNNVLHQDPDQKTLLEIPTSSGYNRTPFEILDALHSKLSTPPLNKLRLIGMLWRLGIVRKITVTPEGYDATDICRCIDAGIARGNRVINMFLHSSDLLPGCTPYVQSTQDKQRFLDCIQYCADHVRTVHNAEFVTMREVRHRLTGTS